MSRVEKRERKTLRKKVRRMHRMYYFFSVVTERIGLLCLIAYFALRFLLFPEIAPGLYVGPLSLLGVAAYVLAGISTITRACRKPKTMAQICAIG